MIEYIRIALEVITGLMWGHYLVQKYIIPKFQIELLKQKRFEEAYFLEKYRLKEG